MAEDRQLDDLARERWEAHATHHQAVIPFPQLHWDELDPFTQDHWRHIGRTAIAFLDDLKGAQDWWAAFRKTLQSLIRRGTSALL